MSLFTYNKSSLVEEALKVTRSKFLFVPGITMATKMPGWNGPNTVALAEMPVDIYEYPINQENGAPFRADNIKQKSGYLQPPPGNWAQYAEEVSDDAYTQFLHAHRGMVSDAINQNKNEVKFHNDAHEYSKEKGWPAATAYHNDRLTKLLEAKDSLHKQRADIEKQLTERGVNVDPPGSDNFEDQEMDPPHEEADNGVGDSDSTIAKKARKGEDLGKPGKHFKQIEEKAAKKYGSKKAGERVAGAIMWKTLHKESENPYNADFPDRFVYHYNKSLYHDRISNHITRLPGEENLSPEGKEVAKLNFDAGTKHRVAASFYQKLGKDPAKTGPNFLKELTETAENASQQAVDAEKKHAGKFVYRTMHKNYVPEFQYLKEDISFNMTQEDMNIASNDAKNYDDHSNKAQKHVVAANHYASDHPLQTAHALAAHWHAQAADVHHEGSGHTQEYKDHVSKIANYTSERVPEVAQAAYSKGIKAAHDANRNTHLTTVQLAKKRVRMYDEGEEVDFTDLVSEELENPLYEHTALAMHHDTRLHEIKNHEGVSHPLVALHSAGVVWHSAAANAHSDDSPYTPEYKANISAVAHHITSQIPHVTSTILEHGVDKGLMHVHDVFKHINDHVDKRVKVYKEDIDVGSTSDYDPATDVTIEYVTSVDPSTGQEYGAWKPKFNKPGVLVKGV